MTDEQKDETAAPQTRAGISAMDALREKHQKLTNSKTTEIPIPGYDGILVARYRVLDFQTEIARIGRKIEVEFKDPGEQAVHGAMDTMINACVELGMWDGYEADGKDKFVTYQEIIPTPFPVVYGPSLVEAMGWSGLNGPREVVMHVFGGIETMMLGHAAQLNRWMGNTTSDANTTFLGNM